MALTIQDLFGISLYDKVSDEKAGIKEFAAAAVELVEGETAVEQITNIMKKQLSFSKIFEATLPQELANISPGKNTIKYLQEHEDTKDIDKSKIKLFLWNNYLIQSIGEFLAHIRMQKANAEAEKTIFTEKALNISSERIALFWNAAQELSQ